MHAALSQCTSNGMLEGFLGMSKKSRLLCACCICLSGGDP